MFFFNSKVTNIIHKLFAGASMYGPQLAFGLISPTIILSFDNYQHNLNYFYIVIFGIGALSSGFSNSLQYVERKYKDSCITYAYVKTYIYSRAVFLPIIIYAFYNDVIILGSHYTWDLMLLLVISSLPGWQLLYFIGFNRVPIVFSAVENTIKLLMIYLACYYDFDVYYVAIVPAVINLGVSVVFFNKYRMASSTLKEFFSSYLPFVSGGILFSTSWLLFMNSVLNVSELYQTYFVVVMERLLRVLERLSTVLATIFFRGGENKRVRINKSIIFMVSFFGVLLSLVTFMTHGYFAGFIVISVVNVFFGHFLQQVLRPNKLFNLGVVLQSLSLLLTSLFTLDFNDLAFAFFIGGMINHIVRVISIIIGRTNVSIEKATK